MTAIMATTTLLGRPITTSDPDLFAARERGELDQALSQRCSCGHERRDHWAATGALGSFGGSACTACWTCGTFNPG